MSIDESTSMFRVVFVRDGGRDRYSVDVRELTAERAYKEARRQLSDNNELPDEDLEWIGDDRDWEWASTSRIEKCGRCGRPYEVALIHKCPTS